MKILFKLLLFIIIASSSYALEKELQDISLTEDVNIVASARYDSLEYDYKQGIAILSGNVMVLYKGTIFYADRLYYNQNYNTVFLTGNVTYIDSVTDANIYAEYVDFQVDSNDAMVRDINVILADTTRVAAKSGMLIESQKQKTLSNAVYTPCKVCSSSNPTWQISAGRLVMDDSVDMLYGENVTIEVKNIPVFWLPFFYYPSPLNTRQKGLLAPEFGSGSNVGSYYSQSYYYPINDNQSVTAGATFYQKDGTMVSGVYDGYFSNTEFYTEGNYINSKVEQEKRWDIDINVYNDYFNSTQLYLKYQDVSDTGFYNFYDVSAKNPEEPYLIKNLSAETYFEKSILETSLFSYKPLTSEQAFTQVDGVSPIVNWDYFSGADNVVQLNTQVTVASFEGANNITPLPNSDIYVNRVGIRPFLTSGYKGNFGKIDTMVGGQLVYYSPGVGYDSNDYSPVENIGLETEYRSSVFGSVRFEYPLLQKSNQVTNVIRPIVQLNYASTNQSNENSYYNFDDGVEISSVNNAFNVFEKNTWDNITDGTFLITGAGWDLKTTQGSSAGLFLAQRSLIRTGSVIDQDIDANNQRKDILQSAYINPTSRLSIYNNASIDSENFDINNFTLGLNVGYMPFTTSISYNYYANIPDIGQTFSETLNFNIGMKVTRELRALITTESNISETKILTPLKNTLDIIYEDECVVLGFTFERDYFTNSVNQNNFKFKWNIQLKTIGGTS